jgi:hypothetical protein
VLPTVHRTRSVTQFLTIAEWEVRISCPRAELPEGMEHRTQEKNKPITLTFVNDILTSALQSALG